MYLDIIQQELKKYRDFGKDILVGVRVLHEDGYQRGWENTDWEDKENKNSSIVIEIDIAIDGNRDNMRTETWYVFLGEVLRLKQK